MAGFDMDQHGVATVQFEDGQGNPTAGPNDSVTGNPVVPNITSDNAAVATAGAVAAGAMPGLFTCQFTPVSVGTFNAAVQPLVNSDGSTILETEGPNAGQPFTMPAPIAVTVAAGVADVMTFAVTAGP